MLLYGHARGAKPFLGGTLCIAPPHRRTLLLFSGGSPNHVNDCTGRSWFAMNWWIGSGNDPGLVPGTTVTAKFWFRDAQDPFQVGLTDAVGFVINP